MAGTAQETATENLFKAVNRSDFIAMEAAIAAGGNINAQNVRGMTPLHAAVVARNLKAIRWLVQHGANPTVPTMTGDTALHDAARLESPDFLEELLESKSPLFNKNATNELGATALIEALANNRRDCARVLVKFNSDINVKPKSGSSALLVACSKHQVDMVDLLLKNKADPNDSNSYGVTALISAAMVTGRELISGDESHLKSSADIIKLLLKHGADVNLKAKSGNTPLAEAAGCANRRAMIALVEAGANPNVTTTAGVRGEISPLMMACLKHDVPLVETLLSKGADVNFVNNQGMSAATMAMNAPFDEKSKDAARKTIEILIAAGAKMEMSANSPIGLAQYGVLTESDLLLQAAKDRGVLDQPMKDGSTAAHFAVAHRKLEMLKMLHKLGANLKVVDKDGDGLIEMIAVSPIPQRAAQAFAMMGQNDDAKMKEQAAKLKAQGYESARNFVDYLISAGVDINQKNKVGEGPLFNAITSFAFGMVDKEFIDFLVQRGADFSSPNENGDTAFVKMVRTGEKDLSVKWAEKLIADGRQELVDRVVFDVAWDCPESTAHMKKLGEVFSELKKLGASYDWQDEDGTFPLMVAAYCNKEDLLVFLLENGANVNLKNNEGEVAAFHSISQGRPHLTKILFENGLDPDSKRNDGQDLTAIAFKNNDSSSVQLIVEFRGKNKNAIDVPQGAPSTKKMGP